MSKPFPLCFSNYRQYSLWRESALGIRPGLSSFCADCTPEHQQRMIERTRCAHPETTFHVDEEGFIEGRRPLVQGSRDREVA